MLGGNKIIEWYITIALNPLKKKNAWGDRKKLWRKKFMFGPGVNWPAVEIMNQNNILEEKICTAIFKYKINQQNQKP